MHIKNHLILYSDAKESKVLSEWIHHEAPLTDKLLALEGTADLDLLSQKWIRPTWWDVFLLDIKDKFIFQREIIMRSHDIAYWYARTIIPEACYQLNPSFFNRLDKESVRNLIFDTQEVEKIVMTTYPIDNQCIEFHWVKNYISTLKGTLWVRYSEFSLNRLESFYLMEILFPELENAAL